MSEKITYLAKLGELTLKGSNIKEFEQRLVENARLYLESVEATVRLIAGRLYIEGPKESCAAIEFTLKHLIGITGWASATLCEKNIESIQKAVYKEALVAKEQGAKSFKIEARRADKGFPLNSYEIACEAAAEVYDTQLLEVNLHNPDVIIRVEIRDRCFVYCDTNKGCRGLPVGTGGREGRLYLFSCLSLYLCRSTKKSGRFGTNYCHVRRRHSYKYCTFYGSSDANKTKSPGSFQYFAFKNVYDESSLFASR